MSNHFGSAVVGDMKKYAEEVIRQLELSQILVGYDEKTKSLHFRKNFRELSIPVALVQRNAWADIRHIYRASLLDGPQVMNYAAANTWSREEWN